VSGERARWTCHALALACVQQPLSVPVPADDAAFRARKGTLKLAARTARRQCLLRLGGQSASLRTRLDPAWRRALWIHEGMPQIGDAMMDLAPRSLLAARGLAVDLFAAPHIAALFEGDPWFARIVSQASALRAQDYDCAIVLSHDPRSLRVKRAQLARLPWVSLQGFYGGPDFHRARFATRRLADLLGLALDDDQFALHSAQKLQLDSGAARWAAEHVGNVPGVALALGGVHAERTYHRWPEVVAHLHGRGVRRLLLVGGGNGRALADELVAAVAGRVAVLDLVGRTGLREAHALLSAARVAACADGGLLHVALATPARVVALFTAAIAPDWRLPLRRQGTSLVSPSPSLDAIEPAAIADAIASALADDARHAPR
jgi:ADP-heptose:LPS heptosyltransferase